MKLGHALAVSLASIAMALVPCAANAGTYTFTSSGSGGDGPLSASAVITTGPGSVSIVLTNTLALTSFVSVGQTISDISFTLSNAAGVVCCSTASGQQGNISSTGLVTYTAGTPDRFVGGPSGGTYLVTGSNVLLEAIGGSQPTQLIAPFEANGATYPDTNPGIVSHDPFTIGPATFTLGLANVTGATTISNVQFSFGTGPDTFLPGVPSGPPAVTPEPESLWLALSGAVSIGGVQLARLRRSTKN
jgi:hypothetical protein